MERNADLVLHAVIRRYNNFYSVLVAYGSETETLDDGNIESLMEVVDRKHFSLHKDAVIYAYSPVEQGGVNAKIVVDFTGRLKPSVPSAISYLQK